MMDILRWVIQNAANVLERLQVSPTFDVEDVYNVLDNVTPVNQVGEPCFFQCSQFLHRLAKDRPPRSPYRYRYGNAITWAKSQCGLSARSRFNGTLHEIFTGENPRQAMHRTCLSFTCSPRYFIHKSQVLNTSTQAKASNNYSAFVDTIRQPSLGPSFAFLTDLTIWLSRSDQNTGDRDEDTFIVEVFRSRNAVCFVSLHAQSIRNSIFQSSRTWCTLTIRNGIVYANPTI